MSLLEPSLFLVNINDLGDGVRIRLRPFADNITFDADYLQENLNKIESQGTEMLHVIRCRKRSPTDHHDENDQTPDQLPSPKPHSGESRKSQELGWNSQRRFTGAKK